MEKQFLALAVGGIVALIIGLAVAIYQPTGCGQGCMNFQ